MPSRTPLRTYLPPRTDLGTLRLYPLESILGPTLVNLRLRTIPLVRYVLPPFQRPPVWTEEQKIRFVESLLRDLPIGTYTYCYSPDRPETDKWLLDGQQRMTALSDYLSGAFPVCGYRWAQLYVRDQRKVMNRGFTAYELLNPTEEQCLEHYLLLNHGGTPHTKADRRRAVKGRRDVPVSSR